MLENKELERLGGNEDLVVLVDVDRCIMNSQYVFNRMLDALRNLGVPEDLLDEVVAKEKENRGNAFDYLAEVDVATPDIPISPEALVNEILKDFDIQKLIDKVFASEAVELLKSLIVTKSRTLLVTAGGEKTQTAKLILIDKLVEYMYGHDAMLPWMIIDDSNQRKAQLGVEAYDEDTRQFSFEKLRTHAKLHSDDYPELSADQIRHVVVIDDKIENVTTNDIDNRNVTGVLVVRAELPDDGEDRTSLGEIVGDIYERAGYRG
jgi:hypothetical protein